ncbi:hypothetical protein [Mesorhizobium sp. WSM3859]|uniref:hypothetical protein n=1 Tax=Mesorhizobium sp. WSM3859 TaxID=2029402 RepID=UPI000BCD73E8|nr:hypothetical protein [Mesorhizobium sp. WSM3859]PBC11331.1 hypothetical protein CK230_04590 [Mesorhizobium sp. WSM3859]
MSIVKEVLGKTAKTFKDDPPTRPKLGPGRFLRSIAEAYSSAIWMSYGAATGFSTKTPTRRYDEDDRI